MHVIEATNVNDALAKGLYLIHCAGQPEESRNGPVLVYPAPVTTVYRNPTERVLFCPIRDANPFFHLMEALWMMGGRNDVAWPTFFNGKFSAYSDDGLTFYGAYGHRWRNRFGVDQIKSVIAELKSNPNSRRAVIAMWSPELDLGRDGADLPCNTTIYFAKRGDTLDMTVCCRSNDIMWGAYGANAVHMSVLQEVIAHAVSLNVGRYYQVSNNYHIYTDIFPQDSFKDRSLSAATNNRYVAGLRNLPMISTDFATWDADLQRFLDDPLGHPSDYADSFFQITAAPMYRAWYERKKGTGNGLLLANDIEADDWRAACVNWILRRAK